MLEEGTIIPIQSTYASPVVLCRKNNESPLESPGAYSFTINYRILNAINKYPRYPLPLIEDLITNIPHTRTVCYLDLRSEYFQLAVNPQHVPKTVFVTKSGTFALMPFGPFGATPNFQKAIGSWLDTEPGKLSLSCEKLKYVGHVLSHEGIQTNDLKKKTIMETKPLKNARERPQSNPTERVNRTLSPNDFYYVEDNHETWDQFLKECAYAIRTAVLKITGKTPVELFLRRKLVMILDGAELVG
ncbi:transposon Ty3-I Gag-Pol polyprotein [Trichonephila clavipes]|uniref:Transposon Ty3-I Gag-Pol polyprotein n=1 Tax=Trichonephila clavipes TaxID=2585209 RepID=A0A8X6RCL7_TRICX|nr:transposon Ty3-I Gag-Pol polyprotein [Trichonephila clavipes]